MSSSEEKTPTISPDQGATGETTTSSENKETGTQTGLSEELKDAREDVEFENYVTLLKEARAQFGREMECAVILYINKHKGEHYYLGCMGRHDKP